MEGQDGNTLEKRVPHGANQIRDIRQSLWWVEPSVWTDRMLAALVNGVKGGKWYSLMDKVCRRSNLDAAFNKVERKKGSAGVDKLTIARFSKKYDYYMNKLEQDLRVGQYVPSAVKRVEIDKPGQKGKKRKKRKKRSLGIPTVLDRIVQSALKNVLEPIFENKFSPRSFGFRPGRGCMTALREVDRLLKEGYTWVVDADIQSYFDTIPHEKLLSLIEEEVSDGRVIQLLQRYLDQEVIDGLKSWLPEKGTPQGAVISPLLSNIYLNPFDHYMCSRGYQIIRYADDFVVLCRAKEEAYAALKEIEGWMSQAGLTLHPEKTKLVDATKAGGFDFLGYHFERGMRWPRKSSLNKLRDTIRKYTKRCNGWSLDSIIEKLNRVLRGWFGYFKHSKKTTFTYLDGWIRMRLRSILRKRSKRKGRGRGKDHQRWPNAYFGKCGLFSLTTAHKGACQSVKR